MTASPRAFAEVIGDPIDHSLSPVIHGFWLGELGIDADYRRQRVERGGLAAYLEQRRADPHWRGCNVTMPLKLEAVAMAEEPSDRAIGTGAANILLPRNAKLAAGNTDVGAVLQLVRGLGHGGSAMAPIVLMGSGGAARAALMALHILGLTAVRIHSRNMAEATALAVQFGLGEQPRPFTEPLAGAALINATPLGMAGAPPFAFALDGIDPRGWVLDFVTSPQPTDLIRRATDRGLRTVNGIAILIEQAAESFKLLFGADPPRDKDSQLLHKLAR